MIDLKQIEAVAHVDFFNQISDGGATLLQTRWSSKCSVGFVPDFAIVNTVIYNTLSTADPQIYNITSSLTNWRSIGSFPGSNSTVGTSISPIIISPQQIIKVRNDLQSVDFAITTYKSDGTNQNGPPSNMTVGEESSIRIDVDFYKLK
jgi:hypothetical protein